MLTSTWKKGLAGNFVNTVLPFLRNLCFLKGNSFATGSEKAKKFEEAGGCDPNSEFSNEVLKLTKAFVNFNWRGDEKGLNEGETFKYFTYDAAKDDFRTGNGGQTEGQQPGEKEQKVEA